MGATVVTRRFRPPVLFVDDLGDGDDGGKEDDDGGRPDVLDGVERTAGADGVHGRRTTGLSVVGATGTDVGAFEDVSGSFLISGPTTMSLVKASQALDPNVSDLSTKPESTGTSNQSINRFAATNSGEFKIKTGGKKN